MFGSWKLDQNIGNYNNLPEEVKTAFIGAFKNLLGAQIVPVMYLGSQVVNGINYLLLATSTPVVSNAQSSLVRVIINASPGGEKYSIVSIDPIA